ncbi:MAG: flagellar basal body P-ring formation chaperone FlgA [Nitrospirota bacterium]|nr:flagellar basal body P-ring formation chaperone FlgA [Nitrospirota bacterium]MDH5698464.1 flagellar basal body P-ring formation chaperone FlgA [Nitrospirota bacterium]
MIIILLLGLLLCGHMWGTGEGTVWAEGPVSSTPVRTDSQSVGVKDFEQVIVAELTRRYGRPHHQVSFRVLVPKQLVEVPKGKLHLEVGEWSGGGRTGRRAFRVGVFVNQQFLKTVNVVGEVKAQVEVATPIRWLKPKEVVTVEDLSTMMVDAPSLTHDFILDLDEVIGKQVLRPLPPSQPIRKIMLDNPPVIHKGDRVLIEARGGGLLVQTVGVAKAAGKAGETISVQNQASGRDVLGVVMSSGLVEVKF